MNHKVNVIQCRNRKYLQLRWKDPITEKQVQKSSGTTNYKEAQSLAHKLEYELDNGRNLNTEKVLWSELRKRFTEEKLPSLKKGSRTSYQTAMNSLERHVNPKRVATINGSLVSRFQAALRQDGKNEATIANYLRHLKAILNWGHRMGLVAKVPPFDMPKQAKNQKVMKGRPITGEEFDRMLEQLESIVGSKAVPSWQFFLKGLWWSGLRLGEALQLYWDRLDRHSVCLDGKRPMLRIVGEYEKGGQDRLLPMAPEFAELLEKVPERERTGRVFKLLGKRGEVLEESRLWVSNIGGRLGRKAGIKVNTDTKTGKVKYASLHDLRRSFGERWATRVLPQVLQQMMRHKSVETTMKFYVGQESERVADEIYKAYDTNRASDTLGDTSPRKPNPPGLADGVNQGNTAT